MCFDIKLRLFSCFDFCVIRTIYVFTGKVIYYVYICVRTGSPFPDNQNVYCN